jgi:hypothetical protein
LEPLYGFLIGMAYWPVVVLVAGIVVLKSFRLRWIPRLMLLAVPLGIAVWALIFAAWGTSAGFAALAGCLAGFALAAVMLVLGVRLLMARRMLLLAPLAMRLSDRWRSRRYR